MIRIYRVENVDGKGMYCGTEAGVQMNGDSSRHPLPREDAKIGCEWRERLSGEIDEQIFGFASLEQLRFWIYKTKWRKSLKSEGFRVSVYEVPVEHALVGDTQAIFVRPEATLVDHLDITEV